MKYIIYLIFSLLSFHTVYAYQIGDVVVTKEGDKGVVFFVSQEKVLLVSLHDIGPVQFSTSNRIDELASDVKDDDAYYIILNGSESTKKIIALSDKYEFPILDSIATDRGWFIPSIGELRELQYQNTNSAYNIDKILQTIGGDSFYNKTYNSSTPYSWTKGTSTYVHSLAIFTNSFSAAYSPYKTKSHVRPIYQIDLTEDTTKKEVSYLWSTGSTEEQIQVNPSTTTTYSVTASNSKNACKSTASHTVFVASTDKQEIVDTICEGETYEQYGFSATETGEYTNTIVNDTCTTDVVLHLTVAPKYKNEFNDEICQGEYYGKNGFSLTPFAKGEVHDTLTFLSNLGCDSMVILNLNVKPTTYDTLFTRICQNEVYKDNDFDIQAYQPSGLSYYTVEKTGENGCKNYYTLALQVDTTYQKSIVDKVFKDSSYTKYGFNLENVTAEGPYTLNLNTANGCDSTVTLKLEVLPTYKLTEEQTICEGTTYTWDGKGLSAAGTYTDSLKTKDGCDSIRTLILTVLSSIKKDLNISICNGSSYTFGGKTITEAGTYTDTLTAVGGCDSIVTLNLSISPIYKLTEEQTICEGSTYTFGGQILSEAGTYTDTLTAVSGCDSIVTLKLKVLTVLHTVISDSTFEDLGYQFGNKKLYVPGTYNDTLTSVGGCDSIVTLHLYLKEHKTVIKDVDLCNDMKGHEGEDYPLIEHKTVQDTIGDPDNYSIVTSRITYHNAKYVTLTDSICSGESYALGNQSLTKAGTYHDTLMSTCGCCDSIYTTLKLSIINNKTSQSNATICENKDFTFDGQTKTYEAGSYNLTAVEPGSNGCDSIITLTLKVMPSIRTQIWDTITVGESYSNYGFYVEEQTKRGDYTYYQTITSDEHCDSIVTLNLVVNPMVDNKEIPTVFSPINQDGVNDIFMNGYEVYIYDRYGNLICKSSTGWNGKYRGEYADPGVYVYVVTMKDGSKKKGTIEVLKD